MLHQNFQTLQTSLLQKLGDAVFNFSETENAGSFFVKPSSQMAVFNFLVYDNQWKFIQLKDIGFVYNPDNAVLKYSVEYALKSTNYNKVLKVNLPVHFSNGKANTIIELYKTAAKYEKVIADIYNIEFCNAKQKLQDFFSIPQEYAFENVIASTQKKEDAEVFLNTADPYYFSPSTKYSSKEKNFSAYPALQLSTAIDTSFYGKTLELVEDKKRQAKKFFNFTTFQFPPLNGYRMLMYILPFLLIGGIIAFIKLSSTTAEKTLSSPYQMPANNKELNKKNGETAEQINEYRTVAYTGTDNKLSATATSMSSNDKNYALKVLVNNKLKEGSLLVKKDDVIKQEDNLAQNNIAGNSTPKLNAHLANPQTLLSIAAPQIVNTFPLQNINTINIPKSTKTSTENAVIQRPSFPGGEAAMKKYFNSRLHMTDEAVENNLQGSVVVKFTVDAKGNIADITLSKVVGYGCDEIIEKFIRTMPRWTPGKQEGASQVMDVSIRILFESSNNNASFIP